MHLDPASSVFEIFEFFFHLIKLIACYKNEILPRVLRIYQEYDNNTNAIHDVLLNLKWEGNWKSNDLTSLGHKLTRLAALCRLRNEAIKFVLNCSQVSTVDSKVCKEPSVTPDETVLAKFQEKILTQLVELDIQLDIYNVRVKQLREEVKATLIAVVTVTLLIFYPILRWVTKIK